MIWRNVEIVKKPLSGDILIHKTNQFMIYFTDGKKTVTKKDS